MRVPFFILTSFVIAVLLGIGSYIIFMNNKTDKSKKPHIVFIVADDMGWNDVSFHGSNQIPTLNIDALAYHGVILNRYYALPTCTPSRTSLLTSRYAIRDGMQGWPIAPGEPRGVPLNLTLMPEYFRNLGYSTHLVGKWHLGYVTKDYLPTSRGFDTFFGYYNGLITYFGHWVKTARNVVESVTGYDLHREDSEGERVPSEENKYFTDLITDEAETIIKRNGNDKPLFLQISHLAVHASEAEDPLEVRNSTEVNTTFSYITDTNRRKYAGMMKAMDESVGRVMTALSKENMLDNSIIVFISDNGAPTIDFYENSGSNYPLRGIKNTLFEGGVRVAACIFSPLIEAWGRVTNERMHIVDWLPTLYAAAGGNVSDLKTPVDGQNLWTMIAKGTESRRKSILLNIDPNSNGEAAIIGRHKLIKDTKEVGKGYYGDAGNDITYPVYNAGEALRSPAGLAIKKLSSFAGLNPEKAQVLRERATVRCSRPRTQLDCSTLCLFDIEDDPCETTDLSPRQPEIVKQLEEFIDEYKKVMSPQMNAEIDPCSDPKFFNGVCMPWRVNFTVPPLIVASGKCQHPANESVLLQV
ncbi:arylsulfatase B-like [Copidosoma floridanum]|uniref:arylsulfatase B-like n=1 Tax=Copidosoma floridanum TaxID=29053 RepID=UPI0006C96F3B|nr:arylsulfatase B-like [Copidosoma floridanum]